MLDPTGVRSVDGRELVTLRGSSSPSSASSRAPLRDRGRAARGRSGPAHAANTSSLTVVGSRRLGIVVSTLVGEQDVVIKALGPSPSKNVRGFAGASEPGRPADRARPRRAVAHRRAHRRRRASRRGDPEPWLIETLLPRALAVADPSAAAHGTDPTRCARRSSVEVGTPAPSAARASRIAVRARSTSPSCSGATSTRRRSRASERS